MFQNINYCVQSNIVKILDSSLIHVIHATCSVFNYIWTEIVLKVAELIRAGHDEYVYRNALSNSKILAT